MLRWPQGQQKSGRDGKNKFFNSFQSLKIFAVKSWKV